MSMSAVTAFRVIPVVTCPAAKNAGAVGEGLVRGGLQVAEVTLRTDAALDVIRTLSERGDLLVGAGSVTRVEQVQAAAEAGATFVVSPGIDEAVVLEAQRLGVPILPGAVTASEIMTALRLGVNIVKFFPASMSGGVDALRALSAPFPEIGFVPTGGITASNVAQYLAVSSVHAVGSSWMLSPPLIEAGEVDAIAASVAGAVSLVGAL